jgi:hypothetical protein
VWVVDGPDRRDDLLPPGDPALDDLVLVAGETVCNAVTHTASGQTGGTVTVGLAGGCGVYRLGRVPRPHRRRESHGA